MKSKSVDEAVNGIKEMKAPKHFLSEMLNKIVVHSLDRSDEDKEHASALIHALCAEGIVTGEHLMQVCVSFQRIKKAFTVFTARVDGFTI